MEKGLRKKEKSDILKGKKHFDGGNSMQLYEYEKKHLAYLRGHLAECTVLLKKNGAFPLEKPCSIAAFGSGVRKTIKGGTGSGEVNSRFFVTVEQGLKNAGFTVTSEKWLDAYDAVYADARVQFVKDIKAQAIALHIPPMYLGMGKVMAEPEYNLPLDGEGEAAIYVLARISGEGNDRQDVPGDIRLSETEKRDILYLNRKFKKFMLVLNAGGPVDLSEVEEVENVLVLSQLGVETGDALADILLGKQNPSGKLATTWSAWQDYFPMPDFGDHNDTRYKEGVYVGYRYFDSVGKRARFPFGFGISYTAFDMMPGSISVTGSRADVQVTVKNTGAAAGKEVAQVYVTCPEGKLDQPFRKLAGFAKTKEIAPGKEETVTVSFDLQELSSFDEEKCAYVLEKGDYVIRVGNSSVDNVPVAVMQLDEDALLLKVRSCCAKPDFEDWKPEEKQKETLPENLPCYAVKAAEMASQITQYDQPEEVDETVAGWTDEQLAYVLVGAHDPKAGKLSIIGNAGKLVAGTAGESTSMLKDQGLLPLSMADGPAGVRLSQKFYRDEKGAHSVGHTGLPDSMVEFMPAFLRLMMKPLPGGKLPKGAKQEEQYATALPIGTALAQSWNVQFVEGCGDIVGDEMNRFGVHLWLAPALNIHRSIRCGRNFEYYSEDPLVSGKMAAAITRGVQSHPGCGVTIKHFCVNNQETNRFGNNSILSERALREIYLRGFGICVKEANPVSVMTSYNLLNGTHTAQMRSLIQDVLRSEFGFAGIVMTDWLVRGMIHNERDIHAPVQTEMVAAAGNDLYMPGCKADFDDMLKGLREGTLTRKQMEINVTRVYRMAKKLYEK